MQFDGGRKLDNIHIFKELFSLKTIQSTTPQKSLIPNWKTGKIRTIHAGEVDPQDSRIKVEGEGEVVVNSMGQVRFSGRSVRMFFLQEFQNVEVVLEHKRVSVGAPVREGINQGIVVGLRSHHLQAPQCPCHGHAYYARILYDGHVGFQKQVIKHREVGYTEPVFMSKSPFSGYYGHHYPKMEWLKFKIKCFNTERGSVKLEIWQGNFMGKWTKLTEYEDTGGWQNPQMYDDTIATYCSQCNNKPKPDEILRGPGMVFIRNDFVRQAMYQNLVISEITQ